MADEQLQSGDVVRFRNSDIEPGECEILGCSSPESMAADWYCVAGPNTYGWFNGSDLELVYRPASRAEIERLRIVEAECADIKSALIRWAREERKAGTPGFSTAPLMRLVGMSQYLLAEEERTVKATDDHSPVTTEDYSETTHLPADQDEVEGLRKILHVAEAVCLDRASIAALRKAIGEHRQCTDQNAETSHDANHATDAGQFARRNSRPENATRCPRATESQSEK
jgi:hypothetical protein